MEILYRTFKPLLVNTIVVAIYKLQIQQRIW